MYPKRDDAAAVFDGDAMLPDWMDRDDRAEEISRHKRRKRGWPVW